MNGPRSRRHDSRQVGLGRRTAPTDARGLDALARILQDIADDDAASVPTSTSMGVWILRRLAADASCTRRGLRAEVAATTWCSGVGPRWAERRTRLQVERRRCASTARRSGCTSIRSAARRLRSRRRSTRSGRRARTAARCRRGSRIRARPADAQRSPWPLRADRPRRRRAREQRGVLGAGRGRARAAAAIRSVTRAEIEFRGGIDRRRRRRAPRHRP